MTLDQHTPYGPHQVLSDGVRGFDAIVTGPVTTVDLDPASGNVGITGRYLLPLVDITDVRTAAGFTGVAVHPQAVGLGLVVPFDLWLDRGARQMVAEAMRDKLADLIVERLEMPTTPARDGVAGVRSGYVTLRTTVLVPPLTDRDRRLLSIGHTVFVDYDRVRQLWHDTPISAEVVDFLSSDDLRNMQAAGRHELARRLAASVPINMRAVRPFAVTP